MLKNVCDSCGSVIDGTPIRRDYPEVMLVIDDEIELVYENLCDKCRKNLKQVLSNISDLPDTGCNDTEKENVAATQVRQQKEVEPEPTPEHDAETETAEDEVKEDGESDNLEKIERTEDTPKRRKPAKQASRELANQVVKQYPINLKKHDGS